MTNVVSSTGMVHKLEDDVNLLCNWSNYRGNTGFTSDNWKITTEKVTCKNCLKLMKEEENLYREVPVGFSKEVFIPLGGEKRLFIYIQRLGVLHLQINVYFYDRKPYSNAVDSDSQVFSFALTFRIKEKKNAQRLHSERFGRDR